jgi:hypothetical protein
MLIKDFFQAFSAGKELANGATWKNAQLLGSKLAILLGALLAIANAFGYFPQVTSQDALTVAGAIAVLVGMLNGTATVVSTTKIGLRGLPASGADSGRGEPVAEPTPADVPISVEGARAPQPEQPDLFHNRSLG